MIWKKDNALFCDFCELFELNEKIVVKKRSFQLELITKAQNFIVIKFFLCRLYSIGFTLFDNDMREFVWSTGSNFINLSKIPTDTTNYLFSTCH